jgi:uncharacterized protein (DUF433 family)
MSNARGSACLATPVSHVQLDDAGVAWIEGTGVKVIEVVLDRFAQGWSPEETHFQHPDLSLAQIHAALAWYYDHQAELDAEIEQRLRGVEAQMAQAPESPLHKRLRAMGRLG